MIKAIVCLTISNTMSLSVYDIEYSITDKALAGFNNDEPEWYDIHYDDDDTYILINETKYSLSDMIRI